MSGGFFRGTSADQDTRFSNKQAKLLKTQKFAPELEHLVDVTKVKMDVVKPWIAKRVTEYLDGFEDEVLINFIYGLLEGKEVNGKQVQIQLTGFMEKNTGKFMKELWALLLSAQKNASGVPQQFLDAKEEETRIKKAETDRIVNEIQRRREKDAKESEQDKERQMDDGLGNNSTEESNRRQERGSGVQSGEENGAHVRNGFKGRSRASKSPSDHSESPLRNARSRSVSKSYSSSRSYSKERSISRSISGSPRAKRQSVSPERRHQSPRRRSITPKRRSGRDSISPGRRSLSRRRSSSRTRYRSPSPVRRRVRSPVRRRSPSPVRRRSPFLARRRSPPPLRRRSRSPLRRRSPSPRRRQSPSPWRRRSPSPGRRKSPSPVRCRRRRSTSSPRSRSRSPGHRRSPSPVRQRLQSPVNRPSYPVRRRSPSPAGRRFSSPARRRSPSPTRRRSQSPARRRSPLSRGRRSPSPVEHRSLSLVRRRSPVPSLSRSASPASRSSGSPVRRSFASSFKMRSPRLQKSLHESPRERNRNHDPAMLVRKQFISLSPQRDTSDRKHSQRPVPAVSPPPAKSPPVVSPPIQARSSGVDRRLDSPNDSLRIRAGDEVTLNGSRSPTRLRDRKGRRGSSDTSEKRYENEREQETKSARSSGGKQRESPDRPTSYWDRDISDARQEDTERSSEEISLKGVHALKKSPHRGSASGERSDVLYPENVSKLDGKKNSQLKDSKDSTISDSLVNSRKKRRSPSVDSESGSEEMEKYKSEVSEKRKHRKSRRKEVASDDTSSESEMEDRKEAKKRRKEEKKLRKEVRRRRREERRRKREEKRASKRKRKSKDADALSSGAEQNEKDAKASNGGQCTRKYLSDEEATESHKKRLEIELREKALESLRAKKGISH